VPRPMGLISSTGEQGFDAVYGLELEECGEELVRGRLPVRDELRQPGGFVHGGVYASIADALAVRGTAAGVANDGKRAIGLATHTTVLHPVAGGAMQASAARRHRGRTTWVWEVEIADETGLVCVAARVTVAVRER
jgi:1,4-dihydroxy-2-naphthoyl-CoA hydrolase